MNEIFTDATISDDGVYRYTLSRVWNKSQPILGVIMLNPSTADANNNDATIRELLMYCRKWGYGGFDVVNLFAFRATNPNHMMVAEDPIGPKNDEILCKLAATHSEILCAWGGKGGFHDRDRVVVEHLGRVNPFVKLVCLGYTSGGHPNHPLGVIGPRQLIDYTPRWEKEKK